MDYFISGMLYYQLSGIEVAQVRRLKLFAKHQVSSKIATLQYNNFMHANFKPYGLTKDDVVNLYDYFQKSQAVTTSPVGLSKLAFDDTLNMVHGDNNVVYQKNGHKVVEVQLFKQNQFGYQFSKDQVQTVTYFDELGHDLRRETYDVRGFLSVIQTMGQGGGINQEVFLTPTGAPAIICDYKTNDQNDVELTLVRVKHAGGWQCFGSLEQLRGFFLDCLNDDDPQPTVFMADKSAIADPALYNMNSDATKIVVRHSTHTYDPTEPLISRLNDVILEQFNHRHELSAAVTATQRQSEDLAQRFYHQLPVYTVPVTSAPVVNQQVSIQRRGGHNVLAVARVHDEKRIEDMITVMAAVRKHIPDAHLEIYGYVTDNDYQKRLRQQITDANLQETVSFMGYVKNMTNVYNRHSIYLMTSRFESFNMALLESLAHGVVPVAYDINYGPSEMIDDGQNGFLVSDGDTEAVAQRVIQLMEKPERLQEMSSQAYKGVEKYSEDQVWKEWQKLSANIHG